MQGTDLTTKGLLLSAQIISQIWPYLSMIMENKFREKLEPKIREKSTHLRTFTFTKLYFGQKVGAAWGRVATLLCRQGPAPTCPGRQPPGFRISPSAPSPSTTVPAGLGKPGSERMKRWGGK